MSISIGSDITSVANTLAQQNSAASKADGLSSSLKNLGAGSSDEELMKACKSFESYLLQQVITNVKDALVPKEEKENDYLAMFGDRLYQEYATTISDSGQIGLAQKLFEAMKRNYGTEAKSE